MLEGGLQNLRSKFLITNRKSATTTTTTTTTATNVLWFHHFVGRQNAKQLPKKEKFLLFEKSTKHVSWRRDSGVIN